MASTVHHNVRVAKTKSDDSKKRGFIKCGYVPDGDGVAPEYLVRITSYRNRCTVIGVLQEDIAMRIESRWEYLVPSSLLDFGNKVIQALTSGRFSLITRATSRRVWQGSSPLRISLNLKFEAVEDAFSEVVQPCKFLQSMALPSDREPEGIWESVSSSPGVTPSMVTRAKRVLGAFLSPPGPTPFTTRGLFTPDTTRSIDEIVSGLKGGDLIKVDLGRFLSFWNVIIHEVSPVFHCRFTSSGDPIGATVNVVFESYEMMTVEALDDAYSKAAFSSRTSQDTTKLKGEGVVKSPVKKVG